MQQQRHRIFNVALWTMLLSFCCCQKAKSLSLLEISAATLGFLMRRLPERQRRGALERGLRWKVGARWYVFALFAPAVLMLAAGAGIGASS